MNAYVTFFAGTAILLLLLLYIGTVVHKTKRWVGSSLIMLMTLLARTRPP